MRSLASLAALDALLAEKGPLLLLKHSTRCPISAAALEEVEAGPLRLLRVAVKLEGESARDILAGLLKA